MAVIDSSKTPITYRLSAGWNFIAYTGIEPITRDTLITKFNEALNVYAIRDVFNTIKDVRGQFWSPFFQNLNSVQPGQGLRVYVYDHATDIQDDDKFQHPTINARPDNLPVRDLSLNFQRGGYVSGIEFELEPGWNIIGYTGDQPSADIVTTLQNALRLSIPGDDFVPIDVNDTIAAVGGIGYDIDDTSGEVNTALDSVNFEIAELEDFVDTLKNVTGRFWSPFFANLFQLIPGEGYMIYILDDMIPEGGTLTLNFQRNT